MRLLAIPKRTIASYFFGNYSFPGIGPQLWGWQFEERWVFLPFGGRGHGVAETDVNLDGDISRIESRTEQHPNTAIVILFADRLGVHRVWPEHEAIRFHLYSAQFSERGFELHKVRIASNEEVGIACGAVVFDSPQREEHCAL